MKDILTLYYISACFDENIRYRGRGKNVAPPIRGVEKPAHCQVLCQLNLDCQSFLFVERKNRNKCRLYANAKGQKVRKRVGIKTIISVT